MPKVRGYIRPDACFKTLHEWEQIALYLLALQKQGIDTRSGEISCKHSTFCNTHDFDTFTKVLSQSFGHQLTTEVERYDLLTQKNVLDFIEDFVNHRLWSLETKYSPYFPEVRDLRYAYFYSRGDMEPYVVIDETMTKQLYGSTNILKKLMHYTNESGVKRIQHAIETGRQFDISSFTVAERPFFRPESNLVVEFIGNVRAGFRSDIKSIVLDTGRRALNLHRVDYPGKDLNNICYELESCDGSVRTSLWNEYIATPKMILSIKKVG